MSKPKAIHAKETCCGMISDPKGCFRAADLGTCIPLLSGKIVVSEKYGSASRKFVVERPEKTSIENTKL
jgi:hypothetical protein